MSDKQLTIEAGKQFIREVAAREAFRAGDFLTSEQYMDELKSEVAARETPSDCLLEAVKIGTEQIKRGETISLEQLEEEVAARESSLNNLYLQIGDRQIPMEQDADGNWRATIEAKDYGETMIVREMAARKSAKVDDCYIDDGSLESAEIPKGNLPTVPLRRIPRLYDLPDSPGRWKRDDGEFDLIYDPKRGLAGFCKHGVWISRQVGSAPRGGWYKIGE